MEKSLNELSDYIVELNTFGQLRFGKNADDIIFGGQYSERTREIKQDKGRYFEGNDIALRDTGDFWKSFFAQASGGKLLIDARDDKTEMLIRDYGEAIIGLSADSMVKLLEKLKPIFEENVTNFLKNA